MSEDSVTAKVRAIIEDFDGGRAVVVSKAGEVVAEGITSFDAYMHLTILKATDAHEVRIYSKSDPCTYKVFGINSDPCGLMFSGMLDEGGVLHIPPVRFG